MLKIISNLLILDWRAYVSDQLKFKPIDLQDRTSFDRSQSESVKWCQQFKLIDLPAVSKEEMKAKFKDFAPFQQNSIKSYMAKFALLAFYSLPNADESTFLKAAKLISWLFERDNEIDDVTNESSFDPESIDILNSKLDSAMDLSVEVPMDSESTVLALRDLIKSLDESDRLFFNNALKDYLKSNTLEARYRKEGRLLTLEQYCKIRTDTGAVLPYLELVRLAEHDVLLKKYRSPEFIDLQNKAALIVGLHNDLFSVGNEIGECHAENYILISMKHKANCKYQNPVLMKEFFHDSLLDTIKKVNGLTEEFEQESSTLLVSNPEYVIHVQRMQDLITGNIMWSKETSRYNKVPKLDGNSLVKF